MKVRRRPQFDRDFAELVMRFKEQAGDAVAWRFVEAVENLIDLLSEHPLLGRERRDLTPEGVRSFVMSRFRNYLVFYRVSHNEVVFMRLRHGAMDLPTIFN